MKTLPLILVFAAILLVAVVAYSEVLVQGHEHSPPQTDVVTTQVPTTTMPQLPKKVEKTSGPSLPIEEDQIVSDEITESNVFTLVNQERHKAGLPVLKRDPGLERAAQQKLADMLDKQYFAHVSPAGRSFNDFIDQQSYIRGWSGENLARNFKTVQETITAWMDSPSHKKNILDKYYTDTGIAVSGSYVVQIFGSEAAFSH